MLIFMYAFGFVAHTIDALRLDFLPGKCETVSECTLSMVDDALRANDVGAVMFAADWRVSGPDTPGPSASQRTLPVAFQMMYYFIIAIFMLNAIFGIILDSFGELRMAEADKKAHMDNTCFVCGLSRVELDTKHIEHEHNIEHDTKPGFEKHIEHEHNMWHYLYLAVHLKEKPPTEYNGWETYVMSQLSQKPPASAFMPRLNAIALRDHAEETAEEARHERQQQMADELGALTRTVGEMARTLDKLHAAATRQTDR